MHSRKNKMSGFRCLESRQRRLVIPNLTKKNHIRRLTKRAPQPACKSAGVTADLSLGEMTAIAGKLILDGILDCHYVSYQVVVHPLKERRYRSGFPGAGRPCYKNQAVPASAPSGQEPLGGSERFQAGHAGLDAAQNRTEPTHGAVQVHAVTRLRARDEPAIAIHLAVPLRIPAAGLPQGGQLLERQGFLTEHDDLLIDLKPGYLVLLKEDVTRLLPFRGVENAVDILRHRSQLQPRANR